MKKVVLTCLAGVLLAAGAVSCSESYPEQVISLKSVGGLTAEVTNRGPKLLSLGVPTADGTTTDVIFNWQDPKDTLEPVNCKVVKVSTNYATFQYPDSKLNVTYRITRMGKLEVEYEGKATKNADVPVSDAIFINLAGMPADSTSAGYNVLDDHLWLNAAESPFFHCRLLMSKYVLWLDNVWKLNTEGDTGRVAACQCCSDAGLEMKVFTTEPAIHVQSAVEKNESGLALTPCDSTGIHHIVLERGKEYDSITSYYFYTFDAAEDRTL